MSAAIQAQLELVQPAIWLALLRESFFQYCSIFKIREKRLDSEVNKALAGLAPSNGKSGVTIEVLMPSLARQNINAPGPVMQLEQKILVKDQPTINLGATGTGITGETYSQAILQTLQQLNLGNICQGFYPGSPGYRSLDAGPGSPFMLFEVTMNATMPLTPLPRCGNPPPPVEDPAFTLTFTAPASDPDAAIYYTLDGSFPCSANVGTLPDGTEGTAQLYTGPFVVESGAQVSWAAEVAGKLGSSSQMTQPITS